eukprot:10697708-Alexandrium_andersonii.AAC.1
MPSGATGMGIAGAARRATSRRTSTAGSAVCPVGSSTTRATSSRRPCMRAPPSLCWPRRGAPRARVVSRTS